MSGKTALILITSSGRESPKKIETRFEKSISGLFLSKLISSTQEEIKISASSGGVGEEIRQIRGQKQAVFYSIEDLPTILEQLKQKSRGEKHWLDKADLTKDKIEINLPSGSRLIIDRS